MRPRVVLLALAVAGLCAVTAPADPQAGPFTANVTNPWFPLRSGTTYVYQGEKDGLPSRDVVTVTHRVKLIDTAPCIAVSDRLYLAGRLRERTTDWYSQDAKGMVWYFGEATAELDAHGRVTSTEGSWQAGRDGALPGVFMPTHPRVGTAFRQEFYKGQAEDHFRIVGLFGLGSRRNALLTEEWTPLEPGVLDHKLYVRGVGGVLEQSVRGGNERAELVAMHVG